MKGFQTESKVILIITRFHLFTHRYHELICLLHSVTAAKSEQEWRSIAYRIIDLVKQTENMFEILQKDDELLIQIVNCTSYLAISLDFIPAVKVSRYTSSVF